MGLSNNPDELAEQIHALSAPPSADISSVPGHSTNTPVDRDGVDISAVEAEVCVSTQAAYTPDLVPVKDYLRLDSD